MLALSKVPAIADYPGPFDSRPNGSWFKFGYPLGYVTDVLQNLEALTALGYGQDPRLAAALELVLSKQDAQGRWKMKYTYNGKMWADVEEPGKPSKWVTLRATRVLIRASGARASSRGRTLSESISSTACPRIQLTIIVTDKGAALQSPGLATSGPLTTSFLNNRL